MKTLVTLLLATWLINTPAMAQTQKSADQFSCGETTNIIETQWNNYNKSTSLMESLWNRIADSSFCEANNETARALDAINHLLAQEAMSSVVNLSLGWEPELSGFKPIVCPYLAENKQTATNLIADICSGKDPSVALSHARDSLFTSSIDFGRQVDDFVSSKAPEGARPLVINLSLGFMAQRANRIFADGFEAVAAE